MTHESALQATVFSNEMNDITLDIFNVGRITVEGWHHLKLIRYISAAVLH